MEDVKRGILHGRRLPGRAAGAVPAGASSKPTTMLYRNMLAMEAEELMRCHPVDGAVLMGGCDKTTPGLLLGATSIDVPAIFLPAGPMLRGNWQARCSARARMLEILGRAAGRQDHRSRTGSASRAASRGPTAPA